MPTDAQKNICGNDTQCIYDLLVTNSTAFAMATNQFNVNNNMAVKLISELACVHSMTDKLELTKPPADPYMYIYTSICRCI